MTKDAYLKYSDALTADIEKLIAIIRWLDAVIGDAQIVLEKSQPKETGRIAIVWEEQDISFGKALTDLAPVFRIP